MALELDGSDGVNIAKVEYAAKDVFLAKRNPKY
jgi:hypothetical protein